MLARATSTRAAPIERCQIEQGAIANASFDLEFDPQLV
jgi:hypothetical protein